MLCPKCGVSNDNNSKFCQGCGGPLNQAVPPQAPPPPVNPVPAYQPPYQPPAAPVKKGHGGLVAVIVILLVLVIAGVGVFFVLSKKDDKNNKDDKTTAAQTTMSAVTTTQNSKETTTASVDASQPSADEVQNILGGLGYGDWDGNWDNLTAEEKQALENYYAALGENIKFTENGFAFVDEDGNVVTWGGKWPDSPLMKDVPKVDFGTIFTTSVETNQVTILFSNVNEANFTDFVNKVKSAGFNIDPQEFNMYGTASYEATNSNGIHINVGMAMGFLTIEVTAN